MYSTLCTMQSSQAEAGARPAEKQGHHGTEGEFLHSWLFHGSGLRQTSVECIKNSNRANYQRETQPLVSLSSARFWSAVDDLRLASIFLPPNSRDWLSLVQGRGCGELQRQ